MAHPLRSVRFHGVSAGGRASAGPQARMPRLRRKEHTRECACSRSDGSSSARADATYLDRRRRHRSTQEIWCGLQHADRNMQHAGTSLPACIVSDRRRRAGPYGPQIHTGSQMAGCHNSTLFPSGSITQPNLPCSELWVSSSTLQPSARSAVSSASRSSTRKLIMKDDVPGAM